MAEYGRIHTDGSRSGGQPVLEPCPVPWCGSSDVKARSFDANHRRHWIECGKCNFKTPQMPSRTKVITLWNTRQPTQSDALLDAEGVKLYWYRQGKDDGVEHERAKIVAWLMREEDDYPSGKYSGFAAIIREEIEAGEHLK